ncbi:glucan endo-1,3-beta-D-glucosidase [Synchytrium endobioticum]|uniref:glucan endo-1,3-beta-D-glucosidase n=1 Tax=Synchytrium endobioticum TaxID=286115 RepID=A0A507DFR1_9FUNG|nr:glucan endo-1,3-beta-D-glucosidase [Synchytrium endobioticum]
MECFGRTHVTRYTNSDNWNFEMSRNQNPKAALVLEILVMSKHGAPKDMIKIAVFGGTQGVGKHVVIKALECHHFVTVLARSPKKLADVVVNRHKLKIIQGDILHDPAAVDQVVDGQDVVIVSLGTTGVKKGPQAKVCSFGQKVINDAMKARGVKRLIVVTSIGVGDSIKHVSYSAYFFIKFVIYKAIADKEVQEDLVKSSGLDWTILRPTGLLDQPPRSLRYDYGEDLNGSSIARAHVAEICLEVIPKPHYGRIYALTLLHTLHFRHGQDMYAHCISLILLLICCSQVKPDLYGINYSPRRSLFACPTHAMITSDLQLLRNMTTRIKTFSLIDSGSGQASATCNFGETILKAAVPLGFRVTLGMEFRGADIDAMFQREVRELERLSYAYPNLFTVVEAIVVGSETLYRGEETQQTLSQRVTTVRTILHSKNLRVPITAADIPPPFYGDILIAAVDFIMINVYPYWEGHAVASAPYSQMAAVHALRERTSKNVVLGECGWPTAGSTNTDAEASIQNLEWYYKQWVCTARKNGVEYFLFEAFDEDWKSDEHAGVEKHWGLFDLNRQPKSTVFLNPVDCSP